MDIENVKHGWGAKRQSVFRAVAIDSQVFGQHQIVSGKDPSDAKGLRSNSC